MSMKSVPYTVVAALFLSLVAGSGCGEGDPCVGENPNRFCANGEVWIENPEYECQIPVAEIDGMLCSEFGEQFTEDFEACWSQRKEDVTACCEYELCVCVAESESSRMNCYPRVCDVPRYSACLEYCQRRPMHPSCEQNI